MKNFKTYTFLNELKLSKEYSENEDLESTYFVIYKEYVYVFDYVTSNYVEKVKSFYEYLQKENIDIPTCKIKNFDDANDFLEYYLDNPKIIAGRFYYNSFTKNIPNDALIAEFFNKQYLEITISDTLYKLMSFLPSLDYFRIDNIIYHKNDLIEKYKKNINKQLKLPEKIYHGTSSEHIKDIIKNGIRPKKENTIFKVEHTNYIFFTTSFDTANRYAGFSTSKHFSSNKVILEINSNQLDKDKIIFDFDFYNRYVGKGNKNYDEINKKLDRPIIPNYMYSDISNKNKGGLFKKFGYDGILLPNKISKIFYNTSAYDNKWEEYTIDEFKKLYL